MDPKDKLQNAAKGSVDTAMAGFTTATKNMQVIAGEIAKMSMDSYENSAQLIEKLPRRQKLGGHRRHPDWLHEDGLREFRVADSEAERDHGDDAAGDDADLHPALQSGKAGRRGGR